MLLMGQKSKDKKILQEFMFIKIDDLNEINTRKKFQSSTEKVIIGRLILSAILLNFYYNFISNFLVLHMPDKSKNDFLALNINYYDNNITYHIGHFLESINDDFIFQKNGLNKFNVKQYLQGSILFHHGITITGQVFIDKIFLSDGEIGSDIINYIHKSMYTGSIFGGIGVSINDETKKIENASGYIIKDYSKDKSLKEKFAKISEEINPSRVLFNEEDFLKTFEIDLSEFSKINKIKSITYGL